MLRTLKNITICFLEKPSFLYSSFECPSLLNKSHPIQVATIKNLQPLDNYDDIELPEKPRLGMVLKVPNLAKPKKEPRQLIDLRGPATEGTTLELKQFGLQAKTAGYMKYGHFEMIRLTINRFMDTRRMFAIWRIKPPYKPITKKGQGQRMGGGKASIDHYVTPVKPGRIVVEIGGKCEFEEVEPVLKELSKKLPFRSKVVTQASLEEDALEEKRIEEENSNEWTFKRIADGNYLGIKKYLGPYDFKWYGKYR
ncbi:39S ribosomal protein L16, mitochondrial-like [Anneissia japonica]|uniref:39S ribosomal protein L16, mitochondrial-like n=1 Tax=Anneissia japonica TaxID=1529436 RepID=UPI0014259A7A|nr:39S ribosomal protein L16, mitochondrial-like [Anneissia japonica]